MVDWWIELFLYSSALGDSLPIHYTWSYRHKRKLSREKKCLHHTMDGSHNQSTLYSLLTRTDTHTNTQKHTHTHIHTHTCWGDLLWSRGGKSLLFFQEFCISSSWTKLMIINVKFMTTFKERSQPWCGRQGESIISTDLPQSVAWPEWTGTSISILVTSS